MLLLISDANILIDMEEGELLEQMFQLPYEFHIPDILFSEELEDQHRYLLDRGLTLAQLDSETMLNAMELTAKYVKTSRNDCFALALAAQQQCPLLTGDLALRHAAENEAVMVQGTLWLVKMLVTRKLISTGEARVAYQKMKDARRRLPWELAEAALVALETQELETFRRE